MAKRKFNYSVGDRVLVIASTITDAVTNTSDRGMFGVITALRPAEGYDYLVKFDTPIELFGTKIEERVYSENFLTKCEGVFSPLETLEETDIVALFREEGGCIYRYNCLVGEYNSICKCITNSSYLQDERYERKIPSMIKRKTEIEEEMKTLREKLPQIRRKISQIIMDNYIPKGEETK